MWPVDYLQLVLLFFFLVILLATTATSMLAWIYSSNNSQQLGVNGITVQLYTDKSIRYYISVNQNEKVSFTLTNFVGRAEICISDGQNHCNTGSAPLKYEWTYSYTMIGWVEIKALDTPTTASLTWDKQTCTWLICSSTNEGKDSKKPMPVTISGEDYGIEASFGSESNHWYQYKPDPNPYEQGNYYSFIASIVGSSGTDFDLYINDSSGYPVASATGTSYPDYACVDATTDTYFIKVRAFSKSSLNEYHLQVHRPYILDYRLSKTTVKPGETFTIDCKIHNPFYHNIGVILGASLWAYGQYYDLSPQCNTQLTLSSGDNWYSCSFKVPNNIYVPGGSAQYALVLGLWGGFCYAYDYAKSYDDLAGCTYKDIPISVQKISTSMTISPSSFTVVSGGQVSFSARLLDSSQKALGNKQITWSSNIGSCNPSTTYTDSNGYASTTCTAPTVNSPTQMTVTAAFGGDYQYEQSSATATGTVNPPTYSVTVDPNGGRIYVDNNPITARTTYSWSSGSTHTLDPDSGYSPSPGVKKIFTQWSDGSRDDPRTITVTGSATYVANWLTQYWLDVSVSPSGAGSTTPGAGWYNEGTSVTVTENPASGYVFDHWELDGANAGTSSSITVSMNRPHSLVAVFREQTYSAVLVVRGSNNRIYFNLLSTDWSNWNSLPSGSTFDAPAAAVAGGKLHIVVRGSDGKSIWHTQVDLSTGSSSSWTKVGGSTQSAPYLTTDGTNLYLIVRGMDNRIYYNVYSGNWSGQWKGPSTGSTPSSPAGVVVGTTLYITVLGSDKKSIYYITMDINTQQFGQWKNIPGSTPSPQALAPRR